MSPLVMIGAVLALLAGADEPAPGSKGAPLERLQGRWTMESVVINGEAVPEDLVKTGTLKIEGNRYDPKLGENAFGATFEIDAAKQPAAIDFTYTAGPQEGKTIKGIFKLDGDTFTMCRGLTDGEDRPGGFDAPAGSGLLLVVWKRHKDAVPKEALEAELKKFEGTWVFESLEVGGRKMPSEGLKGSKLVLKGDKFEFIEGANTTRGVFRPDPTARPKTMDIEFKDGPEKGTITLGIYELDGDTYTLCIDMAGKSRPAEFASKPGPGRVLEVLKRQKP